MKRRVNGEGCYDRFRDGWRGRFTDPVTGKQRAVYGKTQAECKRKLDAVLEEIRGGHYVTPNKEETTGRWLDVWFTNYYCVGTKQSTQATTAQGIRTHLKPHLGMIPLQKLNTDNVQAMIRDMIESGLAPSTIARQIKILKQCMTMAVKRKKIRENPCNDVELPAYVKPEIAFLSDSEQETLKKHIPDTTHGRAIRFLLGTGMRVSELCGLKWKDIQTDGIHVERINMTIEDWKNDGYINVENLPKTTRGKRIIPLTETLKRILNRQQLAQKQECLKTCRTFDDTDGYIFANTLGKPADRNNLSRSFRSICKKAGIDGRGIHSLRHTFATNWVRKSPDIPSLSRILGHADAAFTYKTYCHADQTSMANGMEIMEKEYFAIAE